MSETQAQFDWTYEAFAEPDRQALHRMAEFEASAPKEPPVNSTPTIDATPSANDAPENSAPKYDLYSAFGDKKARNYQETGVEFLLDEFPVRKCIADQMRLGKTPQSLLAVKNLIASGKIERTLYIVRGSNLWQWVKEHQDWVDPTPLGCWPITSTKGFIPPGFKGYIVSMDSVRILEKQLIDMKFDLVVVDEAQFIKDPEAARTIAFNKVVKESKCENVIFLTGTPIKNRAVEYFTILNTCAPQEFPTLEHFKRNWLDQDQKGKWSRIKEWKLERFRELTKSFILRREKEDVYDTLPEFDKVYTRIKIEEKNLQALYNKELDKMNEKIAESGGKVNAKELNDSLMILRRICGMAKVKATIEYVEEFMESESQHEKIAIGVHHEDVISMLKLKIPNKYGVLTLTGKDSPSRKFEIMNDLMRRPQNRVLIISMLAGGVGMDFHYINNFLVTERQWNPADEEQFEFRFYNPDLSIKQDKTFGEYFIAKGTIDEYWHNMVMNKKEVLNETYENHEVGEVREADYKKLIEETLDNRL